MIFWVRSKPTWVRLIYSMEQQQWRIARLQSKKTREKRICSEVSVNSPGNPWSQSGRRKGRLRWEGFAEKESFKWQWRNNRSISMSVGFCRHLVGENWEKCWNKRDAEFNTSGHILIQSVNDMKLLRGGVVSCLQLWPDHILAISARSHSSRNHGRHADAHSCLLSPTHVVNVDMRLFLYRETLAPRDAVRQSKSAA